MVHELTATKASIREMPWGGSRAACRLNQATCSSRGASDGEEGLRLARLQERLLRTAARMAPAVAAE